MKPTVDAVFDAHDVEEIAIERPDENLSGKMPFPNDARPPDDEM